MPILRRAVDKLKWGRACIGAQRYRWCQVAGIWNWWHSEDVARYENRAGQVVRFLPLPCPRNGGW